MLSGCGSSAPTTPLERACKAAPATPTEHWTGPISDAHIHDDVPPWDAEAWAIALLQEMNEAGVQRVAVVAGQAVPAVAGQTPTEARRSRDRGWVELASRCPRLLVHVGGVEPTDEDPTRWLDQVLATGPFAGVGAIELADPAWTDAKLSALARAAGRHGLPLQVHLLRPDPELHRRLRTLARSAPGTQVIGFGCQAMAHDPPNLGCLLTWSEPLADGAQGIRSAPATAMLGCDVGPAAFEEAGSGPRATFAATVRETRRRLLRLPPDQAKQLAAGRFDAVYGGAKR